jgi:hypothetical protein
MGFKIFSHAGSAVKIAAPGLLSVPLANITFFTYFFYELHAQSICGKNEKKYYFH